MTLKNIGILIILLSFCVACGNGANPYLEPDFDISISEHRQLTRRYNCQNQIESESMETVYRSRSKVIKIEPFDEEFDYDDPFEFTATHQGNGTSAGRIEGYEGVFLVNLTGQGGAIKVQPGLNRIKYQFKYCSYGWRNSSGEYKCWGFPSYGDREEISIHINYLTTDLPGEREVKPSAADCGLPSL